LSTLPSPPPAEPDITSFEALDALIAAVADLQSAAEQELRARREWLSRELASVEAELTEMTDLAGDPQGPEKTQAGVPANTSKKLTLSELIAELEAAPERTLNIRKAHLDVKSVKALAKANPQRLEIGGKGKWPTVTLVELSDLTAPDALVKESPQSMFPFEEAPAAPRRKKRKSKE
jgi:hypothetical protein